VVSNLSRTTFIIDGLDECSQADRRIILGVLSRVMCASPSPIKLLLSSREGLVEDVDRVFQDYQAVTMHCEEAQADVRTYVNGIIQEKIESGDLPIGSIQLVEDVKDALIRGASGM
jgi:hypothetical protein